MTPHFLVHPGSEGRPPLNTPYISQKGQDWGLATGLATTTKSFSFGSPLATVTSFAKSHFPSILTPARSAPIFPPIDPALLNPPDSDNQELKEKKHAQGVERKVHFASSDLSNLLGENSEKESDIEDPKDWEDIHKMLDGEEEIGEDGEIKGNGEVEENAETPVSEIMADNEIEGKYTYIETCNRSLMPLTDSSDEFSAIIEHIMLQLNNDPAFIKFSKSPGNPTLASACINRYLQVADFVDKFLGTSMPQDLEFASEVIITEVCFPQ